MLTYRLIYINDQYLFIVSRVYIANVQQPTHLQMRPMFTDRLYYQHEQYPPMNSGLNTTKSDLQTQV